MAERKPYYCNLAEVEAMRAEQELEELREQVRVQREQGWRITEQLRNLSVSAHLTFKSPPTTARTEAKEGDATV